MRTRALLALAFLAIGGAVTGGLLLTQSSENDHETFTGVPFEDPGPVHVHGLGVNPADGALFIATHTGLYRVDPGASTARRVGERFQDTMGFTVVGPGRFLGSGHPDVREAQERGLPPHLGLIESKDAGKSWTSVSLLGEADFHVLRSVGDRVYGYDASNDRLLASADRGESWREVTKPGSLVDLVADPTAPRRLLASVVDERDRGLFASSDGGKRWRKVSDAVGLLAWPRRDRLYVMDGAGRAHVSSDLGRSFVTRGAIGGEPAALVASADDELYAALHDGTIMRSADAAVTWVVRSRP